MLKEEISRYLSELNHQLGEKNIKGELCLYGGAVMCLAYDARPSTKDVDAVFKPATEIRELARHIADKNGLRPDWLNDAVKGFVTPHEQKVWLDLPNLKVYVPEEDYLLAMKAFSARLDTTDKEDLLFLIKKMGLKQAEDVFSILEKYYPLQRIKPATRFFVEEIFES